MTDYLSSLLDYW